MDIFYTSEPGIPKSDFRKTTQTCPPSFAAPPGPSCDQTGRSPPHGLFVLRNALQPQTASGLDFDTL